MSGTFNYVLSFFSFFPFLNFQEGFSWISLKLTTFCVCHVTWRIKPWYVLKKKIGGLDFTAWVKIKVSQIRKKKWKYLSLFMDRIFYMILMYVMLTIIDQKIIEFEFFVFELCPVLQKYTKIKFSHGSLHSKQVVLLLQWVHLSSIVNPIWIPRPLNWSINNMHFTLERYKSETLYSNGSRIWLPWPNPKIQNSPES